MTVRPMLAALALALALALPAAGRAQEDRCAALLAPGAAERQAGPGGVTAVQAGLRAVFGSAVRELSDGILGPVSRDYLARLCAAVPLPEEADPVAGTVGLAEEYAAVAALVPDWRERLADQTLLAETSGIAAARRLLHFAGPPALKQAALAGAPDAVSTCASLGLAGPAEEADLSAGLAALLGAEGAAVPADPAAALAEACALYPAGTDAAVLAEAVRRIGEVEAAVPGAAEILQQPAFAAWLAEAPADRVLRLLGTPDSIVMLLRESGFEPPAPPTPLACTPRQDGDAPVYFSLTAADLERLIARTAIAEALAPVAEARFADRAALVAAINAAIGVSPADCAALIAERVTAAREAESQVHFLDPERLEALKLDPAVAPMLPVLEPMLGLESPSRPQLLAGLDAAIRAVAAETVEAEIVAAADAAAAAAEEVDPPLDAPAIPVPSDQVAEPRTEFAITDPSLLLLKSEVPDPELFEAISDTEYEQVGGRPVVRARVLQALRPIAETRIAATTAAGLAAVEGAVVSRWRLVEPAVAELAAEPDFAAVAPDLVERLGSLAGIAYPTARLFDRAMTDIAPPLEGVELTAIEGVARKSVDPIARRAVAPVAADCGCVAPRWEFDSLVYGFYPFWQFAEAGGDPAAMPRVDFELVERIAFDGLEIGEDARLRYAPRWNEAAGTFTVSARRHLATVDLAVRVRGWRGWSEAEIGDAAFAVAEELRLSRRGDPLVTSGGPFGWLDRYIDRRPDGVTLVVDGYTGARGEPPARNLVAFVRALAEELAGTGQTVNLAFDIPLVGVSAAGDPLFEDLREVILQTDPLRPKLVENVIVFVERPTAEAKKLLRARLENTFSGEDRWTVLRHLVPTVPPGGNAVVPHGEGPVLASAEPYAQFHDDVLYFQDNFRGVGFWPAPAAAAAEGAPDRVAELVRREFDAPALPAVLAPYGSEIGAVCRIVCPNRLAFYLAAALAVVGVLAVKWLSLHSRRVRSLTEAVLVTPLLGAGLAGLLVLVATCDRSAELWAPVALAAFFALASGLAALSWYGRRLDGPVP